MKFLKQNYSAKPCIILTSTLTFLFGSGFYKPTPTLSVKPVEVNKIIINEEPLLLEAGKEATSIGKILDLVFVEGYSQVSVAKQVEEIDPDSNKTKFTIDSLVIETKDLNFNQVGEQEGTITVYDKGSSKVDDSFVIESNEKEPLESMDINVKHNFDVKIEIGDTKAPDIYLTTDEIVLDNGEEIVPEEWIDYVWDDVDGRIETWEFDGSDIDSDNAGHYVGIYSSTDKSGNTSTKELQVAVKRPSSTSRVAAYTAAYADYSATANTSGSIYDLAALINNARANYGLHALSLDTGSLGAASQLRAMEASTYVSHYRPNGTYFTTALDAYGVSYGTAGEVLTYAGTTPSAALNWWLSSPAHAASLLSGRYSAIGIGYYNGMWSACLIG